MQSLPAWKTQHSQRSYQEWGVGTGYWRGDSISPGKQGVTNIRRISIRIDEERIETNTYIRTFYQPLKEVKIGYCLEKVEQYFPARLRPFQCQKYGHYRDTGRRRHTCAKCGEKDPDHLEKDCLKQIWCPNCQQDHPTNARSCDLYKKEKGNIWGQTQEECVLPGKL